jgi:hypothetical protein
MSRYFQNFSTINYNGSIAIDITKRVAILNSIFGNRLAFYPYQVKDGIRPDQVAERYYGSTDFVWLVYMSNNIVDPYYEWPMDSMTFNDYIRDKYGSMEQARAKIVSYRVNWYEDTTKLNNTQYNNLPAYAKKYWTPAFDSNNLPMVYERKKIDYEAVAKDDEGNVTLSVPVEEQSYWSPVTAYDMEEERNADKAHIRLLDNRLAETAASNLRQLLRD